MCCTLLSLTIKIFYFYLWAYVHGGEEGGKFILVVTDARGEMELQMAVNHMTHVLGTKLRSSESNACSLLLSPLSSLLLPFS